MQTSSNLHNTAESEAVGRKRKFRYHTVEDFMGVNSDNEEEVECVSTSKKRPKGDYRDVRDDKESALATVKALRKKKTAELKGTSSSGFGNQEYISCAGYSKKKINLSTGIESNERDPGSTTQEELESLED